MVARGEMGGGLDKIHGGHEEVQTSIHKIDEVWGWQVQHRKYHQ